MTLSELRGQCLAERRLYEDLEFPAHPPSIHPSSDKPADWVWKRPKDLCPSPKFVVDGAKRFDFVQGEIGDCWFPAAAAVLASNPELFARVVPQDQGFIREYAGIFRFHLWRCGEWVEVIIDDKLPATVDGALRFSRNRGEKDEFWLPLFEKAYAKLNGGYHTLHSGYLRDALVDFTGGVSESYHLCREDDPPPNLFEILSKSFHMGSLLCAGVWSDAGGTTEEELWDGLYRGHAYYVTAVKECAQSIVKMSNGIRDVLSNPWMERQVGPITKSLGETRMERSMERGVVGMAVREGGGQDETRHYCHPRRMAYDDLVKNFNLVEIVHLPPDTARSAALMKDLDDERTGPRDMASWHEASFRGCWVNGVNAGGSGMFAGKKAMYYSNPQYFLTLFTPDADHVVDFEECACVVSLLQKDPPQRKTKPNFRRLSVRFDIHTVRSGEPEFMQDETFFDKTRLKKQFSTRSPFREISCRLGLSPGCYVIIPNTLQPHKEGEFLLRILTYSVAQPDEIVETTGIIPPSIDNPPPLKPIGNLSADFFFHYAVDEYVVDARELRDLLNELARRELRETTAFSVETCRTLIAMFESSNTGCIDFVQTGNLWDEILHWRKLFTDFDKDDSGCIETYELRNVFRKLGFTLSFDCLSILAKRYGGKDRTLFFEDFVMCVSKTQAMYDVYKTQRADGTREIRLGLEEWMRTSLYY